TFQLRFILALGHNLMTLPENERTVSSFVEISLVDLVPFDRFATIVTSDSIERAKPDPDAYNYCLQQLEIAANEAIAIEDTPIGINAAKAAGIITIGTPEATTTDRDLAAADLVVHDLTDISLDLLSALLDRQAAPLGFS
ncbi:HAD family hydrolase, partial [Chamaesiphon polymorphus]